MQGSNVNYDTFNNYSCWVPNNDYDMYEVPLYGDERSPIGEYLFLTHNTNFDYWCFGKLTCYTDCGGYIAADFVPYGKYTVFGSGRNISLRKDMRGYDLILGGKTGRKHHHFDEVGVRRRAYNCKNKYKAELETKEKFETRYEIRSDKNRAIVRKYKHRKK